MSKDTLRLTPQILDRLNSFADGPVAYLGNPDEDVKAQSFYGVLYGLRVKNISQHPVILNCSGNAILEGQESLETLNVEFLSELLPIGLDPVGVLYLSSNVDDVEKHKVLAKLIDNLPDQEAFVHDPIVITKNGDGPLTTSTFSEGEFKELQHEVIDTNEINQHITTIRLRGKLEMFASANERDIVSWIRHAIEKVSSPYGTFRMDRSDVFFLHTFAAVKRSATGWSNNDLFKDEYVEECDVSNIESLEPDLTNKEIADKYTIGDLWKLIEDEDEEDDGFGVANLKKKKVVKKTETMDFSLFMKMSGDACTSKTRNCAPVIHYEKVQDKVAKIPLCLDGLAMAPNDMKIVDVMELLKGCAQRQVHILGGSILSEFKKLGSFSKPEVFHLKPEPFGHFASIVYTQTGSCSVFAPFRMKLHQKFLLKPDRPYFRRLNRFTFDVDKPTSGPLTNVHLGLAPSGVGGEVAIVKGAYSYHHYMQDGFNDDGWGCAYRSLQTLLSWFRHQGYANTPIPTHEQIQKCLVDIGDKEKSFIGSKQWIGSTEVGFVLETSCQIQSKFLSLSSGEDLENKGRELAHHFKTNGTPIMIGKHL